MKIINLADKKQFKQLSEDCEKYVFLHYSKGIELEGIPKKLSAEVLEEKKDPNDKDRTVFKFCRPLEALPIAVIEELTGLTSERIRAIELIFYLINKNKLLSDLPG